MVGMAIPSLLQNTAPHTHVSCTDAYFQSVITEMDKAAVGLQKWLTVSIKEALQQMFKVFHYKT